MNIPCVQQFICHRRDQRGIASLTALVLLVIMLFMGRGLIYFAEQGVRNGYVFRQEMEMRLVAESMAEQQWLRLKKDDRKLQNLRENAMIPLAEGTYEGMDYTVFARSWGGNIYLIATAFRRSSALDEIIEPHFMVKGVLGKVGEHYEWLGWAP